MTTLRIGVSIGHRPDAVGAKFNNVSEYSEMAILAGLLIHKIERTCHKAYIIGTGKLSQKIADINDLDLDACVELHLNSGGGHGYETLYCPGSAAGKELAASVNNAMGIVLHSRNRGIKEGWYRMDPANGPNYFLKATNCPAIITEMFFLDNPEERAKFLDSSTIANSVAERIAAGILAHLSGVE